MGWFWGSDEVENTKIDAPGTVTNVLNMEKPISIEAKEILLILLLLLILKLLEMIFIGFSLYKKSLKKKYAKSADLEFNRR